MLQGIRDAVVEKRSALRNAEVKRLEDEVAARARKLLELQAREIRFQRLTDELTEASNKYEAETTALYGRLQAHRNGTTYSGRRGTLIHSGSSSSMLHQRLSNAEKQTKVAWCGAYGCCGPVAHTSRLVTQVTNTAIKAARKRVANLRRSLVRTQERQSQLGLGRVGSPGASSVASNDTRGSTDQGRRPSGSNSPLPRRLAIRLPPSRGGASETGRVSGQPSVRALCSTDTHSRLTHTTHSEAAIKVSRFDCRSATQQRGAQARWVATWHRQWQRSRHP